MVFNNLERFLIKYSDKINWRNISGNSYLSEKFFEKFLDKLVWHPFCNNPNISEEFLARCFAEKLITGGVLTGHHTEAFLEKHLDFVDWITVSQDHRVSLAFLERHLDRVHWQYLCSNTVITDEFVERHLDRVSWYFLSGNSSISEEFLLKYLPERRISVEKICSNPRISETTLRNLLDKKIISAYELSRRPGISEELLYYCMSQIRYPPWDDISSHTELSLDFFRKHLDKINWKKFSANPSIPESFFEEHLDKVHWDELTVNPGISEEFLIRYRDKIRWHHVNCRGPSPRLAAYFQDGMKDYCKFLADTLTERGNLIICRLLTGNPYSTDFLDPNIFANVADQFNILMLLDTKSNSTPRNDYYYREQFRRRNCWLSQQYNYHQISTIFEILR